MKGQQYFPFERNHYYYGKLLSADILDAEQTYMNDKRRFLNRFLHGAGVICGMSVLAADERTIAVQPGAALDFAGREIIIDQPLLLTLSNLEGSSAYSNAAVLYLCLTYDEYPQRNDAQRGQYDVVSEHYHFSLSETAPLHARDEAERFYVQTETVYRCDAFTVQQQLPVMARAGGETMLTVHVQRQVRDAVAHFSYQVRLTGMKCGEERVLTIAYDSRQQTMTDDHAVLNFPLHVLLHADGEEAGAETVPGTFVSSTDQRADGFSIIRMNTEVVVGSLRERLLQRFRDEGMQQINRDHVYQPPICLAAIHMNEKNGSNVISHIERMPFSQYVLSSQSQALAAFLEKEEQVAAHQVLHTQSGHGAADKLMQRYAVASGVTEIAMPMGGRAGQRFYSKPIAHGLGIGRTSITLGFISSESETVYGHTGVFAEGRQDVSAEMAAKLDMDQGTFVIGVLLTEPTAAVSVRIHWTAVHSHTAEVTQLHPHLLIKPDVASLNVMENLTFEVQFEQCPKQAVQWSIAEGARGGVITDGGAYTAPNTPGVYQIQVKAVESGMQATAFVAVRDLHNPR